MELGGWDRVGVVVEGLICGIEGLAISVRLRD